MQIHKPVSTIIIFVIAVVVLFLFVLPAYSESYRLQADLSQRQGQLDGQAEYRQKITAILAQIEQNQEVLAKVDSALPSTFSLSGLVYFFQQKAAESGLVVKSIAYVQPASSAAKKTGAAAQRKEVKDTMVNVNIVGSYPAFRNFLRSMETSARLVEANTISFVALQPAKGQSVQYEFKLGVKTHSY